MNYDEYVMEYFGLMNPVPDPDDPEMVKNVIHSMAVYEATLFTLFQGAEFLTRTTPSNMKYGVFRKRMYSGAGYAARASAHVTLPVTFVALSGAAGLAAAKQGHTTTPFGGGFGGLITF
jgi:hypothetical protein